MMGFELFVIKGVEITLSLFIAGIIGLIAGVIYLCWVPYTGRE